MIHSDVIIVGGGPAGSTCAWKLQQQGVECLILDKQTFPRLKLCAGWITPEVLTDLRISPEEYPHNLTCLRQMRVYIKHYAFTITTHQYAIRRVEFDDWLLRRCGAPIHTYDVKQVRRDDTRYVLDDRYSCNYLVGAGGTYCPVYRGLFKSKYPRSQRVRVVTLEQEFPYPVQDGMCHLWFFQRRLPGYAWYVPKGNDCVNIGIGGLVGKLKTRHATITQHWQWFVQELKRQSLVNNSPCKPGGYMYFTCDRHNTIVQQERAFLIGDAAGLATRDLAEGIGPAVRSGILAADAIISGKPFVVKKVRAYSLLTWRTVLNFLFRRRTVS